MRRLLLNILVVAILVVCGWYVLYPARFDAEPQTDDSLTARLKTPVETSPTTPITPSHFLNTTSQATYVGKEQCAECHSDQHKSFSETPHSAAMAVVEADAEPPDATFQHDLSGRSYRVHRRDSQLRHEEAIQSGDEDEEAHVLSDHVARYVLGSGHHSRTYVVQANGFLVESPLTWYASKRRWLMSPGYDRPNHRGFRRVISIDCLFCHAGRVEMVNGQRNKVRLFEHSIACESCHGPGSLHVAQEKAAGPSTEEPDLTIVHLGRLPRAEQERICAQCHLRGVASVDARGRHITDYRPGLKLTDFRVEYGLEQSDDSMTVVGHIQQMRLSRCYQESAELTCTTCHSPHDTTTAVRRGEYFRQKCFECHRSDSCGLDESDRSRQDVEDNCLACHMPRGGTDIPHFVFTHHRIGVHKPNELPHAQLATDSAAETLIPLLDVSHLPQIEQDRGLGLAYLRFSETEQAGLAKLDYRQKSLELLEDVYRRGLRGPDLEEALAILFGERGASQEAMQFAESAVRHRSKSAFDTMNAWAVLGNIQYKKKQFEGARQAFEQLTKLRRASQDWVMLGGCLREMGDTQAAIQALQTASEIDPARSDIHQTIAEIATTAGRPSLAGKHDKQARSLRSFTRRRGRP
ncbi:MAG: hypothetical protein CMJ64_15735 [Planctomycetaceae bacterium]|nr:hypothetical protein [Planctomycetaceae bacterium]